MFPFGTWVFPLLSLGAVWSLTLSGGKEKTEFHRTCREKHVLDATSSPHPYLPFPPEETGTPQGVEHSMLIVPGTHWCGESNVARNLSDLGTARETDACCRTHDQCPYFIGPFQAKYNYRNHYPWSLSLCRCDRALYTCLKDVHSVTSHEVGTAFFGLLDVKCFTFEKVKYCETYHWTRLWCEEENTRPAAVVRKLGLKW